jgi:MSHA biogenesis protein MshQ
MIQRQTISRDGISSNANAIRGALLRLVALFSLLLFALHAQAATDYVFSSTGPLPYNCSLTSTASYSCGVVTLADGDTITVGSFTPVTVTFSGAFTTGTGNLINITGAADDLNIVTNGVLTMGAYTSLNANVTGTAAINMSLGSTIGGNLTASTTTGVLTLAKNSTVGGFIRTDSGAVTVGSSSTVIDGIATQAGVVTLTTDINVGGDISTDSGAVTVGSSSAIGGSITTQAGVVTLTTDIDVGGDISTVAGAITIGSGSSTCGSVFSTGAGIVTITNVQIGGDITTVAGAITASIGSTVGGDVNSTGAGVVTLTGVLVGGKVETSAGAITLTDSRVGGTVVATGVGGVTLTNSIANDTSFIVPTASACSVKLISLVSDHHFDESSWSGIAGEVLDSSGNDYHGVASKPMTNSTDGVVCNAADFSETGASDYVSLNGLALNNLDDFSISIWGKLDSSRSGPQTIFSAASNSDKNGVLMFFSDTKTLSFYFRDTIVATYEFTDAISDDEWHHYVWTRKGDRHCLFMDGVSKGCQSASPFYEGSISVASNGLIIGQEQDSVGGRFDANQDWEGLVDELMIFSSELSSAKVRSIHNNQSAGKNYDGSVRTCRLTPVLEYNFDEPSWNGSTGEVADTSNTGLDGTAIGNATTTLVTEGQVCRAGTFDGTGDYIDVTGIDSYLNTTASLSFWIKSSQKGNNSPWRAPGIIGVEQNGGGNDIFWGYLDNSGRIRIKKGNGNSAVSAAVINDVNWQHVVLTYDSSNGAVQVFINGSLDSSAISQAGDVSKAFSSIGRIEASSGLNFMGKLDELLVFDSVISPSDVSSIYNNQLKGNNYDGSARVCPTTVVDHYEIVHDGQGLTCEAESVTIKAHDANHNLVAPSASTAITLSTSIANDGWTLKSGNGSFNAVTAEYTFDGTETQVELGLSKTTATVSPHIDIDVTDGTSTDLDGDIDEDKNLTFADTGFRFLVDDNSIDIPTQLSGKPSNAGYNASDLSLQAIKTSTLTGACEAALVSTKDIELVAECIDPIACADKKVIINTTHIETQDDVATPSYTEVSLDFGSAANNTARFDLTYPDAGKVQLHARYNIPDELGNLTGNYMLGSSNTFVVRPFGFYINAVGNPKAENATGTIYKKAGEEFTANVTAIQWQAEDDNLNNDGIPDDDSNLSDNDLTPNFGQEMMKEKVVLAHQLIEPSGGSLGSLTGNIITNFTHGKGQTTDLSWSEVGIIDLTASLYSSPYIDANSTFGSITGSTPYVGRFIPDHFDVTITNNSFADKCITAATDFTYIGQPFTYLNTPKLLITAKNLAEGTTQNYTETGYQKLTAANIVRTFPIEDTSKDGTDNATKMVVSAITLDGNLTTPTSDPSSTAGEMTYTFNSLDSFTYSKNTNSKTGVFTSIYDIVINSIEDSDGANASTSLDFNTPSTNTVSPTGVNLRFGRWQIENTFGPETSNLPVSMAIQYWNGSDFLTNTLDSCTAFDGGNVANYSLTLNDLNNPLSATNLTPISGGGVFALGDADLQIGKPTDDSRGQIRLTYDATPTWLQYDWSWNGVEVKVFDENPSAIATFGLYRGNDRIIYMREVFN